MKPSDEAIAINNAHKLYRLWVGTEHEQWALEHLRRTVDGIRRSQIAAGLHRRNP